MAGTRCRDVRALLPHRACRDQTGPRAVERRLCRRRTGDRTGPAYRRGVVPVRVAPRARRDPPPHGPGRPRPRARSGRHRAASGGDPGCARVRVAGRDRRRRLRLRRGTRRAPRCARGRPRPDAGGGQRDRHRTREVCTDELTPARVPAQSAGARRRPMSADTITATNSAAPLHTSAIQLSTPASENPVIVKARKKIATSVPTTLNRPGRIAVAPRNTADSAWRLSPTVPAWGLARPFRATRRMPAKAASDPDRTNARRTRRSTRMPTRRAAGSFEPIAWRERP